MHTNPSNKVYIGITCNVKDRWRNGKGYKCGYFSKAIKKYGWNNIKHELLADGLTIDKAKEMEIELIEKYKSNNPNFGYNLTKGGDGTVGYKMSDETKRKIAMAEIGFKHSEETKLS